MPEAATRDEVPPWDLAVVGAGPAGSTAALAALRARPGLRVALVDAAAWPRDKTCGDGVAREALAELADLGVDPAALTAGTAPVQRLDVVSSRGTRARGPFPEPTAVVPRLLLDARLRDAALAAGAVPVRQRVRALRVRADRVELGPGLAARAVVGADGAGSAVRRLLGLPPQPAAATAVAVRGYADAHGLDEQVVRMVADGWPAYAWAFPVGDGRANTGFGALLPRLPDGDPRWLHRRLAALVPEAPADPTTLRAAHLPLATWRPRQPDGPVLLAGDAASLVNPLTGEGIWYAVVSGRLAGEAAAEALGAAGAGRAAGAGAAYRSALQRRLGTHLAQLAVLGRVSAASPRFVDAAVAAGARDPDAFDAVVRLGLAGGHVTPRLAAGVARALVRR